MKIVGVSMSALLLVTGCGKVPKLENGQDAVVTMKGNDISIDTLYNEVKEKYALQALIDLVDTQILNKKYKDTEESKKEVKDQIELMSKQYGGEDKLLQAAANSGLYSMSDLENYLKLQYKKSKAVEDYAKSIVKDDEIEKYYEEKIFGDITAKHILISPKTTDEATDAEKTKAEEDALKLANEIISKLKKGEKFEDLAKKH